MSEHNGNIKLSKSAENLIRLKEEISHIIDRGRKHHESSDVIVEYIFRKVAVNKEMIVEEDKMAHRPANMKEIVYIAERALKHAEFDGAVIVLPAGKKIRMKGHGSYSCIQ